MQRQNKHSLRISIESRPSRISSIRSLERPSWSSRNHSLSKRASLIEVMSLENGRKSDLYDKMLDEAQVEQPGRQSLGAVQGIGSGFGLMGLGQNYGIPVEMQARKSQQVEVNINHTCDCYQQCSWQTCSCRQARYELCIKDYCCQVCIQMKQKMLKGEQQIPPVDPQTQSRLYCNCKKIKCKKMYCTCYAAGVLCGPQCSCEGCTNCILPPQPQVMQQERQQISEEQLARMNMPQSMDFEPFQFRLSNNATLMNQ